MAQVNAVAVKLPDRNHDTIRASRRARNESQRKQTKFSKDLKAELRAWNLPSVSRMCSEFKPWPEIQCLTIETVKTLYDGKTLDNLPTR